MRICAGCFKAEDWKDFFSESRVFPQKCSFCGRKADVVEFRNLFPFIHKLLTLFKKSDSGSRVYEIINDDFGIFADNKVARKIFKSTIAKAQCGYSIDDSVAYIDDVVTVKERWLQIKNEVMKEHRFFTVDPTDESWDVYFASDEKYKKIKKGSKFFRGRINEDAENLFYEESELGMPPPEKARAGRINPYGIPCLYLTKNVDSIIYELRASHGDKISIGTFVASDDLNIIDFDYRPLVFDDVCRQKGVEKLQDTVREFLLKKQIGFDLSKPIHRYGVKEIEYVPTQYICEYIKIHGADGVMFNSAVHRGGKNLVLFKSDKVKFVGAEVKTVDEPVMRFCQ